MLHRFSQKLPKYVFSLAMKNAIGFDPGIANCGYGVVARGGSGFSCLAYGNIQTDAKTPHPDRLLKIYQHVSELITEWNPSKISIESVYWNRNQKSCLLIAEVIGILQLAAVQKDIEVVMLSPQFGGFITRKTLGRIQRQNFQDFCRTKGTITIDSKEYPRLQFLCIEEILEGKRFDTPLVRGKSTTDQMELFDN